MYALLHADEFAGQERSWVARCGSTGCDVIQAILH
jgi:hypothetical protein